MTKDNVLFYLIFSKTINCFMAFIYPYEVQWLEIHHPDKKKVSESHLVQLFKYKSCSIEKEVVHVDMKRPYHLEHAS